MNTMPENSICYTGVSMYPVFQEGDRLIFRRQKTYRRGDIIAYLEPGGDRYIIHRIIAVSTSPQPLSGNPQPGTDQVMRTAGDNNPEPDSYLVDRSRILGRIIKRHRAWMLTVVWGGLPGYLHHLYGIRGRPIIRRLYAAIAPLWFDLTSGPVLSRLLSPLLTLTPVIVITRDSRILVRLYAGPWRAGEWDRTVRDWYIRRRFRPFIDKGQLPDIDTVIKEGLPPDFCRTAALKEQSSNQPRPS
ncbi:MAG: signal peptidase I [Deltaproteobacteria bacterium]|nr:signal peptidase I [Deltaproteobacteria bacterium]